MSAPALTIQHLDSSGAPSISDWRRILTLAKRHSGTLGFMPDSAFADRVRGGTLIVARVSDEVVGYCLYDLPRTGYIKLVHVCVGESARGLGVGKALVAAAADRNPNAIGVLAYCRRDYEGLDHFWESVGLSPRGERDGRAVNGSILSAWWRPLGALDLIEEAALSAGLPLVAYDTNVVSDLYASSKARRPDREASIGLLAGWVQAAITPVVSPRVDVELHGIKDRAEREGQRQRSQELLRLRSNRAEDSTILNELRARVGPEALLADNSLSDDLCHVADAIGAGVSYLVTNDQNLLRVTAVALPGYATLRVLRPHELVTEILNRLDRPVFQSRLIESVDLSWRPASTWPIDDLVSRFLTHEDHERAGDLARVLRAAMSKHPRTTRVLADSSDKPWALLTESSNSGKLIVELFRVDRGPAASTVALQLARHVRVLARDNHLQCVRIVDEQLSAVSVEALAKDGFEPGDGLVATLIDEVVDRDTFLQARPEAQPAAARNVRNLERKYWPLILIGTDVPTYIAPIQPRYAELLFGIDRGTLWSDRKRGLGLSREHVYYSGSSRALPPEGARILWYVTHDDTGTVRQLMAYSRSLGCQRMLPEKAHAANAQIGVFSLRDVKAAAGKDGIVTVVRFEDTEILPAPIGRSALSKLFKVRGVKPPIPSFRKVDPALFEDIVSRQPGRTK